MAFGSRASSVDVSRWKSTWSTAINRICYFLVLAGSKTAEIEGVSAAGATKESRRFTAIADAEFLLNGTSVARSWPLPPLPGGVSPALISHVASRLIDVKPSVVVAGLPQKPTFSCLIAGQKFSGPSECLTTGKAMDIERVETLWQEGFSMGLNLSSPLLLTECVPGGTTTALAVLTGLGISAAKFVSSSNKNPPTDLKRSIVEKGLESAKLDCNPSPKDLLAAVGDPFQPFAVGLLLGARYVDQPVLLGGGSQMVAVLALALTVLDYPLRDSFVREISIATTSWLANECLSHSQNESAFSCLIQLVEKHFDVSLLCLSSGLRFTKSSKKVLRDYERGFIKEGVGAGALTLLAQVNGISCTHLMQECERTVDQLNNFP